MHTAFLRRRLQCNLVNLELGQFEGTDVQLDDVFCFTNFLSGFLFKVRGRVRVRARGGFRVRVRVRTSVGG